MEDKALVSLRKTFPHFNEEQIIEMDKTLTEHIKLALEIWDRVIQDPAEYEKMRHLLAKHKVWKETDVKCRCSDCRDKFEKDFDASHAQGQAVATTQETTSMETPCK